MGGAVLRPVVVVSLTEVYERIALRRVAEGRIALFQGRYLDHGRPVPDYLPGAVESLLARKLAALAEPGADQWRRVTLTPAGQAYHEALGAEHRRRPDPPPETPPSPPGPGAPGQSGRSSV